MRKGKKHVISKAELQNRPLTLSEKISDFFNSSNVIYLYLVCIFLFIIAPFFFLLFLPFAFLAIKSREVSPPEMPFFFPASSGVSFDPFNPKPAKNKDGSKNYRGAEGIVYFGNDVETNLQCWFNNDTIRQHVSFLAATGSGKTFTMIGIFNVNSLIFGAGYILVDGKADLDLALKEISLLFRFNRVDDFFLINYIQGDANPWDGYQGHLTTNTFNMLDTGTAASCIESFKSLMTSDNDIWAKRADALAAGLLSPLCYLRDERVQFLNIGTMIDYLTVESSGLLCSSEPIETLSNIQIPKIVNKNLFGFMKTLPGMTASDFQTIQKGESVKSTQVYDQYGYCSMQLILVCNMLAGDYQKIFGCESGDINQDAIVLTDRILLALLPALEASPQSVASMGRIVLSSRKAMMGRSLGNQIEGEARRNIETRPTNSAYPFINVMDEIGMYFDVSEGPASAQSRSLGFALAYLAQDLPAMGKLSEEVAKTVETVMGNTIIKVCGKVIDEKTRDLYIKLAGEHLVWQKDRIEISASGMNTISKDTSASYVKENRLDEHEIQQLKEGELFVLAADRMSRVDGPTMVPIGIKHIAINQFVPWLNYPKKDILDYTLAKLEFDNIFNEAVNGNIELEFDTDSVELVNSIISRVDICQNNSKSITESFMLGFASYATMQMDLLSSINGVYDLMVEGEAEAEAESDADALTHEEPVVVEAQEAILATESNQSPPDDKEPITPVSGLTHDEELSQTDEVETDWSQGNEYINDIALDDEDDEYDVGFDQAVDDSLSSIVSTESRSKFDSLYSKTLEECGTSKEELIDNLIGIDAKAAKIELMSQQVADEKLNASDANTALSEQASPDEIQMSSKRVETSLASVEVSLSHPTLPIPQTNAERTVAILTKLRSLLEQQ